MSLKTIPGLGRSGMSLMWARRSTSDLPQVADQQQVLEMGGHGGEVLERLDRLLAPRGIAGAQRRLEDLLQQRRLPVGRRAEDAQVAPRDPVAGKLRHRADDLALGLVVPLGAVALLALDDAVVLELGHELGVGAGLLEDVVERERRPALLDPHRRDAPYGRPLPRGGGQVRLGAPARQLVADDPQGQELVALQAQDRAQATQVLLRVEPVAARGALGLQELLVLEVADLRDRDVGELRL